MAYFKNNTQSAWATAWLLYLTGRDLAGEVE
jgi:hypothetical protein